MHNTRYGALTKCMHTYTHTHIPNVMLCWWLTVWEFHLYTTVRYIMIRPGQLSRVIMRSHLLCTDCFSSNKVWVKVYHQSLRRGVIRYRGMAGRPETWNMFKNVLISNARSYNGVTSNARSYNGVTSNARSYNGVTSNARSYYGVTSNSRSYNGVTFPEIVLTFRSVSCGGDGHVTLIWPFPQSRLKLKVLI